MVRRNVLCRVLLLLLLPAIALAQDVSSKITGLVTDASGAVVAGAAVSARETGTGTVYPGVTNGAGLYYLSPLPVGNYTVTITAAGFSATEHAVFTLAMDQTARLDFALKAGGSSTVVEVTSAAPLLQTDDTFLGTVLDAHANVTLPLATRNYNQLTLLSPGAVSLNPGSFTGSQSSFQVGRPYINGNREQTNNYILDGNDNNQIDNNDVAFSPSVDAIQEFNLISQNAPASYGNYLGGIISVTIKSGTNQFHGGAFEFIRNDALNANTWKNGLTVGQPYIPGVNNPSGAGLKAKLRWNEFGGTFGGPILKDKLFFFVDYQGSRFDQPATSTPYTVLTTRERAGDFGQACTAGFSAAGLCLNPANQLYNPYSSTTPGSRQPFLFNRVPTALFSPAASKILSSALYPAPLNALTTGNQINRTHSNTNGDQGDVKINWTASEKDHVYLRYSQQHIVNPTTNSQLLTGDSNNQFPLYNAVIDYAHTFSPTLLNSARVGGSYFPVTQGNTNTTGQNLPQVFGIAGASPTETFLPSMTFAGNSFGPQIGNLDLVSQFHDTVLEGQDTLTVIRGKHTVALGAQFYYYKTNILYVGNSGLAGQFIFDGSYTGNAALAVPASGFAEADFLLGLPQNVGLGSGSGKSLRNKLVSGFVQDDWRVRSNLSFNLGLRYEVVTPRAEAHGLATNYDLNTGAVQLAGVNGNSKALYNQYNGITNYQPRLGVSFQPEHNTVVRAAYGISNFSESTGTGNLLVQNPPFATPRNVTYDGTSQALPGSTLDQGYSGFPSAPCTAAGAVAFSPACFSGTGIHAFSQNGVRPAVSQQYNVTVQRQLGNSSTFQVSYVGQKTDHLMTIALINQKVLQPNGTLLPSPYLNATLQQGPNAIGQARLTNSNGYSNYNALQTSFQQRLKYGLEFQFNYTLAKCLGNSSGFFAQYGDANANLTQAGNNHFFFQNTYNPSADYGRCDQDVSNSFNGYATYHLPIGRGRLIDTGGRPLLDEAIGGWQLATIVQVHGGFPITAQGNNASGTVNGFPRADCTGAPRVTPYKRSTDPNNPGYTWLDAGSVSQPKLGTFGNCAVGSFRGPGLKTADLSVQKDFTIHEAQTVQFRAEAINFLNHPILTAPNSTLGTTFGLVNNSQGERQLQFALKYGF